MKGTKARFKRSKRASSRTWLRSVRRQNSQDLVRGEVVVRDKVLDDFMRDLLELD